MSEEKPQKADLPSKIDGPLSFVIDYEMYPREQPSAGICYHCGENRMLTHNFKAVDHETFSAICRNCALKWVEWDKPTRKRLDSYTAERDKRLADRFTKQLPGAMFSNYGYPEEWNGRKWAVYFSPSEWRQIVAALSNTQTEPEESSK